ncbi:MAG: hypothetical protein ACI8V2_001209 [Candidatus Latescibacterota bacterium]|jgi:hypothetical protein
MSKRFQFEHEFIETDGGYDGWGAVVVADFDGDGRPEFATGGKGGGFYHLYDYDVETKMWVRHVITNDFSPNVGAAAVDLDGDGRLELVCGEWGDRLMWLVPPEACLDNWTWHVVGTGLNDPHDVLAADLNGDGRDEIIVREKDGRLMIFQILNSPYDPWHQTVISESLHGDGTSVADLSGNGALDIVTNMGWFENVKGDASVWEHHPLIPDALNWHPESRLVVGDVDGDGHLEVVITESEIGPARLAILRPGQMGALWTAEVVLNVDLDLRALHSLQIADLDGDGRPEIFTAEMENGKTDGVQAKPRWWCLAYEDKGWVPHILLDTNLGTHSAVIADYDGDGCLDIVGKLWRANASNGNGGRLHVDCLWNRGVTMKAWVKE